MYSPSTTSGTDSVQVVPEFGRAPQLVLGAGFNLADALARQVKTIADFLQRARLIVSEAEAQAHDLALLAVEIEQRRGELVEVGLMDHLLVGGRHAVLLDQIAELTGAAVATSKGAAMDRLVQRHVRAAARTAPQHREQLRRKRKRARLI